MEVDFQSSDGRGLDTLTIGLLAEILQDYRPELREKVFVVLTDHACDCDGVPFTREYILWVAKGIKSQDSKVQPSPGVQKGRGSWGRTDSLYS